MGIFIGGKFKTIKHIKKVRKIVFRILAILLLLFVILIIVFSIPSVQTKVAKRVTSYINETYGTQIQIDRLGLNWKAEVDIRDVFIADHHNDTLIYTKQLQTNILSVKKLIDGDLDFGTIKLTEAKFYMKAYKGEDNDNISVFANSFKTKNTKNVKPFLMYAKKVILINSKIKYIDENLENSSLFDYDNVTIDAQDFSINDSNIDTNIKQLSFDAKRGYIIKNLAAKFSYNTQEIILDQLDLKTDESQLKGKIILNHKNGFADFVNKVPLEAHFEQSHLATNNLNVFYNEFGKNQTINLSGDFQGTLNNFNFNNAKLTNNAINVKGDFTFKNVLHDRDFSIEIKNHHIQANYFDLKRLMPRMLNVLPHELKELGSFTLTGNTSITKTILLTKSDLKSKIGRLNTDIEIGNIQDIDNAYYNGQVQLHHFNLAKIIKTESLGLVNADLQINGRGFTQKNVNTEVSGAINSFEFEGYNYQNMTVSGALKYPLFNGDLAIDDPNLQMNFKGLVDVSKEFNQFDFEANVNYAELNKLNLIKRDSISIFAGKIIMDMDGTTIDDAVGTINFQETFYQNENDDFYFDDFMISSAIKNKIHTIKINSPDILNGKITGNFLIKDIPNLFRNGIGSIYTNYIPLEVTTNQYIDYDFEVFNKIVDVFVPQLKLGDNTKINGSVSSDESKFKLNFKSPELLLFNNYLGKVKVKVDNDNPLFNTFVSVDSIYTGLYNVSDLNFINKTLNDTLYIRTEFKGGKKKKDLFNLSLYHTINPEGKSVVGVKKSEIKFNNNTWSLNEDNNDKNKIIFSNNFKDIKVDYMTLSHLNEQIEMAGFIRENNYKNLKLSFKDVNLGNIIPEIDSLKLDGNVNGNINFLQKGTNYYPNSSVTIDDVKVNDIYFGNLDLNVKGNSDLTVYSINTNLINDQVKSITAIGEIDVSGKNPQIELDVNLNDFNVAAFSPLGGDVITNMRGDISGNARLSGNYKSPNILGTFFLNNAGLKIPYLNVDFDIENNTAIAVTQNKLNLTKTKITDTKYNTQGFLFGNATHNSFRDWKLDLQIEGDRLLVLDTPPDEDELYYGTAFISGTTNITGPIDELVIDVVASTEEGTVFKIPISDVESIGDDSFIKFISPKEKAARLRGETVVAKEIKGLSLNFELDINTNAEVEVVIDKENNSKLKGRGAGTLLLEINTLGKFNMWGDFIVYEGVYDFRYGGLIQKTIAVERDGTITWDGSPTKAILNLKAKYETTANPSVLLDNPTINRKIPIEVIVELSDEILHPILDFKINFPKVSSIVKNELEYKLQDKQQREIQALYLISSSSFAGDGVGQNAITRTLAERVNGIVADLFSDSDSKFKVLPYFEPGSRSVDQETADKLGVAISTQISERIIINGKVGVPLGGVNETAVAGDVEVQWLVNEDGSLRLNFFNRQAELQFIGEDQIFEQGAGISYSVDFDTFKELIRKIFGKEIDLELQKTEIIPNDNTEPVHFNPK